jgi:hypothetical protein
VSIVALPSQLLPRNFSRKPPDEKPITAEDCKPLPGGIQRIRTRHSLGASPAREAKSTNDLNT